MSPRSQGVWTGFGFGMIFVHALLALMLSSDRAAPVEYLGTIYTAPLYFRIALSPVWLFGVPVVGIAVLVALLRKQPARGVAYVAPAIVLAVTATATAYIGMYT